MPAGAIPALRSVPGWAISVAVTGAGTVSVAIAGPVARASAGAITGAGTISRPRAVSGWTVPARWSLPRRWVTRAWTRAVAARIRTEAVARPVLRARSIVITRPVV